MRSLLGMVDEAGRGRARFCLLVGPAGIGKTRTAEAVADVARGRGFRVLWGACHEREGAPPFWPWVRVLRGLMEEVSPRELDVLTGVGGEIIALLPDLGGALRPPGSMDAPGRPDEANRFRMFDAVGTVLRHAARHRPLLLVLDDLHWADESSLLLLEFVVREIAAAPILLLGSLREADPGGRHSIADILRRIPARTLRLGGLGRNAVRELLARTSGGVPSSAVVERVHALTEGNPLFVIELAGWIAGPRTVDVAEEEGSGLPESVVAVISRRLDALTPTARTVARIGAVVGREFEEELLGEVSGVERGTLEEALEEAVRTFVILRRGAAYRFRHPLLRRALYDELTPEDRIRAHARIARALERRPIGDPRARVAALAHHYARAEPVVGPAKVIEHARAAAEQALATHAYGEAVIHFRRALECKSRGVEDDETAALSFGLGRALAAGSPRWNRQDAWNHLRRAAEHYLRVGDVANAVWAGTYVGVTAEGAQDVLATLDSVRGLVEPGSREAGWLLARHAAAVYFETGDYARARASFEEAVEIARRISDVALELRALAYGVAIDHFDGRLPDVLIKSRRVMVLARRIEDGQAESYARYRMTFALAFTGRSEEAEQEARANLRLAEALHDRGALEDALWINAVLAQLRGDWARARELSELGLATSPEHLPLLHARVLLEHELGNAGVGGRFIERLREASARAGPYPLRGTFYALAEPQVAELAGSPLDRGPRVRRAEEGVPVARMLRAAARGLTAVEDGDAAAARDELARLEPGRGTIVAPLMVTDRLLGRLAETAREPERARRHFADALRFSRAAGYEPETAWTCHDYARLLFSSASEPAAAEARRLRENGLDIADRLGMSPLAARLKGLGPSAPHGLRAALTRRELDVLRLLVEGRTNREIGTALFISENTVAVHVARILEKTATRNRTEAAGVAIREALLEKAPGE